MPHVRWKMKMSTHYNRMLCWASWFIVEMKREHSRKKEAIVPSFSSSSPLYCALFVSRLDVYSFAHPVTTLIGNHRVVCKLVCTLWSCYCTLSCVKNKKLLSWPLFLLWKEWTVPTVASCSKGQNPLANERGGICSFRQWRFICSLRWLWKSKNCVSVSLLCLCEVSIVPFILGV